MFPQDASQEQAAASQAVAGAPERGVRSAVPTAGPQVSPIAPRAFAGRGVFVSGRRTRDGGRLPPCRSPFVHTPGPAAVAGPIIPS